MSVRPVTVADHEVSPPQIVEPDGSPTWLTCGANFVIAVTRVRDGTVLQQGGVPDEAMLFLPDVGATIEAGGEQAEAPANAVAILPPGDARVTANGIGTIVRVYSSRVRHLYERGVNAADYVEGAPDVAPLTDWPTPPAGFRLRVYPLDDLGSESGVMRVFRSSNLMINPISRRTVPRDVGALSPHSHADFEQASLALEGHYIHHCRYPWTRDLREWRADEHLEVGSPSVTVIPPGVIHTSRNVDAPGFLVDVFAPPRADFAARGIICNDVDYPNPVGTMSAA